MMIADFYHHYQENINMILDIFIRKCLEGEMDRWMVGWVDEEINRDRGRE